MDPDLEKKHLREIANLPMPNMSESSDPLPQFSPPGISHSPGPDEPIDVMDKGGEGDSKDGEILETLKLIHEALVGIREDLLELPDRVKDELVNS